MPYVVTELNCRAQIARRRATRIQDGAPEAQLRRQKGPVTDILVWVQCFAIRNVRKHTCIGISKQDQRDDGIFGNNCAVPSGLCGAVMGVVRQGLSSPGGGN